MGGELIQAALDRWASYFLSRSGQAVVVAVLQADLRGALNELRGAAPQSDIDALLHSLMELAPGDQVVHRAPFNRAMFDFFRKRWYRLPNRGRELVQRLAPTFDPVAPIPPGRSLSDDDTPVVGLPDIDVREARRVDDRRVDVHIVADGAPAVVRVRIEHAGDGNWLVNGEDVATLSLVDRFGRTGMDRIAAAARSAVEGSE